MCHFVHPTEKEWDTAELSYPPRPSDVVDNNDEYYYELVKSDRLRHQSSSSVLSDSHRERRPKSSPSRSPRGRRRPRSRNGKRSHSPATSMAESDQLEKLRRDDGYIRWTTSFPRHRTPPPVHDRDRNRRDRPVSVREASPSRSQMSITKSTKAPPPNPQQPPAPPPMRPPPTVPTAPPFLSIDLPQDPPAKSRSLSVEELRKLWHERVEFVFLHVTVFGPQAHQSP